MRPCHTQVLPKIDTRVLAADDEAGDGEDTEDGSGHAAQRLLGELARTVPRIPTANRASAQSASVEPAC